MSFVTFLLDTSVINACTLYSSIALLEQEMIVPFNYSKIRVEKRLVVTHVREKTATDVDASGNIHLTYFDGSDNINFLPSCTILEQDHGPIADIRSRLHAFLSNQESTLALY